jgi:phage terminase large subunit-like protein
MGHMQKIRAMIMEAEQFPHLKHDDDHVDQKSSDIK